jgi:DNA-binding transcriptional LysR family regulator
VNVPIELLRTLIAIPEHGSLSKAAERLKLTQPAVSSQMKRLSLLVGGPVFGKKAGATILTERGKTVLEYAKSILEQNDRLVALAGGNAGERGLRFGICAGLIDRFVESLSHAGAFDSAQIRGFHVVCDTSQEIAKGLGEGFLDAGCLMGDPALPFAPVKQWGEELVWVRSREFALLPGTPVPLIGWPERDLDKMAVAALEASGVPYQFVFSSPLSDARIAALNAGLGFGILPRSLIAAFGSGAKLLIARDRFLPPLPAIATKVYLRPGPSSPRLRRVLDRMIETYEALLPLSEAEAPSWAEARLA